MKTLDIKRIGLLMKRFFVENKQRELIFFGILTLVFTLIHEAETVKLIIYITGFIFAARQFKVFSYTPGGMHYLLIPATHAEKLITSILLSTIYFFSVSLAAYSIGNVAGTYIQNSIMETNNPANWGFFETSIKYFGQSLEINQFLSTIGTFVLFQSVFILGSLYFKRSAVGRTWLCLALIVFALGLLQLLLFNTLWGDFHTAGKIWSSYMTLNAIHVIKYVNLISNCLTFILIPYFWIVSYYRLTEKQV